MKPSADRPKETGSSTQTFAARLSPAIVKAVLLCKAISQTFSDKLNIIRLKISNSICAPFWAVLVVAS